MVWRSLWGLHIVPLLRMRGSSREEVEVGGGGLSHGWARHGARTMAQHNDITLCITHAHYFISLRFSKHINRVSPQQQCSRTPAGPQQGPSRAPARQGQA